MSITVSVVALMRDTWCRVLLVKHLSSASERWMTHISLLAFVMSSGTALNAKSFQCSTLEPPSNIDSY